MEYKTILKGVVGSTAYGLDTPDFDIDERGCFLYPTDVILGFHNADETLTSLDPNITLHELKKFIRLAANCNPNILEVLWLDNYTVCSQEGQMILDLRESFLCQDIRTTYGGYAMGQIKSLQSHGFKRLQSRGDGSFKSKLRKRKEKHARHCFRLLLQGRQLLEEGRLDVKVSNPEELFEIGRLPDEELIRRFDEEFERFQAVESDLPLDPNFEAINELLLSIRKMN